MAMADDRQRHLPLPEDRVSPRGRELAFPEAVLLVDPIEPEFKGEVKKLKQSKFFFFKNCANFLKKDTYNVYCVGG